MKWQEFEALIKISARIHGTRRQKDLMLYKSIRYFTKRGRGVPRRGDARDRARRGALLHRDERWSAAVLAVAVPYCPYPVRLPAQQSSSVKIYWVDTGSDDIKRANLDGSSPETVVTGVGSGNRGHSSQWMLTA